MSAFCLGLRTTDKAVSMTSFFKFSGTLFNIFCNSEISPFATLPTAPCSLSKLLMPTAASLPNKEIKSSSVAFLNLTWDCASSNLFAKDGSTAFKFSTWSLLISSYIFFFKPTLASLKAGLPEFFNPSPTSFLKSSNIP